MLQKRGAVTLVANTFESFPDPSEKHLRYLYNAVFVARATVNQPIGNIQQIVAGNTPSTDRDVYTIGDIHQSMLQGGPVLRLVTVGSADYTLDPFDRRFKGHCRADTKRVR